MEDCYADASVNSILLLKERIIKVETLLNKYACLAKKCKDLEKSHNDLAKNERNAKKYAVKYLGKYCSLTKKCSALLTKIKNLEELLKEKTDLVVEHQNELVKLDSLLKVYKAERQNCQKLEKDKNFLLSFVWRLLKDSRFETKDNKNRRAAETIFKRFERDLEDLKLVDFKCRKLKKSSKSIGEELETSSFSDELPILSNIVSSLIDVDEALDSVNCVTTEEIDSIGEVVQEFKGKPNDNCVDRKYENDTTLVPVTDNTQRYISGINGGLFQPSNSEKCVDVETEKVRIDVDISLNKNLKSFANKTNIQRGFAVESKTSACSSMLKKEIGTVENFELKKNESCNSEEKNFIHSPPLDKSKIKELETKETSNKFASNFDQFGNSNENSDSKAVLENILSDKQYRGKLSIKHPAIVDFATDEDMTHPHINSAEFSDEINGSDIGNTYIDLYGQNKSIMTERKRTSNVEETSLQFLRETDLESGRRSGDVLETEKSEIQIICPNSLTETGLLKDKLRRNICNDEIQEKGLEFSKNENEGKFERDQGYVHNSDSISNAGITNPADVKSNSDVFGMNLKKSRSTESFKEIPDVEIFCILEKFKTVRLISPIKDMECTESRKRGGVILKSHRKHVPLTCLIKDKLNDEKNKVQTINETAFSSGNGSSEKPVAVEASTQTDDLGVTGGNGTKEWCPEQSPKLGKPATPSVTKRLIRKVVRKIWNGKLKNKMKIVDEITKIWKTHPWNIYLKSVIKYLAVHSLNREKSMYNLLRNGFIKSRYKSKMRAVKKKLSPWKVEDSTDIDAVSSQSQNLLSYSGKASSFVTDDSIYNNLTKRLNNICLPQGMDQHIKLQQVDWMTNQRISCAAQTDVFRNAFGTGFPVLLREITLNNFKKENENFRSLPIDNYGNFISPFSIDDCDMLDVKDIPKSIIHCDSSKLITPENDNMDKSEFHEKRMKSFSPEAKWTDRERHRLVPRRSSRIQNRNNRLKDIDTPPKCEFRSSDSSILNNSNSSDIDYKYNNSPVLPSPTGECENSMSAVKQPESWENPEEKYKVFGETVNRESTEIPSDNCSKIHPDVNSSPEVSYNLRRKTVNNVDESCGSRVVLGHIGNRRLSKRLSKTFIEDAYYSEGEIEERSEMQLGQPEKTQENDNLLDTIMAAMTKQTEEFKTKTPINRLGKDILEIKGGITSHTFSPDYYHLPFPNKQELYVSPQSSCHSSNESSHPTNFPDCCKFEKQSERNNAEERNFSPRKDQGGNKMRVIVEIELSKFLKAEIKSVEEGEEILKPCLAAFEKASENVVASVIVAEVMANVDEELQDFDRPAPPLTQTQHRLMTILTILPESCKKFSKICYKILKTIWSKLFPEKFFWPDDSVEMASRFYSALCRKLNYFKGMWRFCFKAVSSMRQRWCIPIFVVLQVWPDILHNATDIRDNILVKAFVYVILHTPKSEDIRRRRQEEKILAIKHLLINFYNFEVNVTIEELTCQLFELLSTDTPGSSDALIFVAKCRQWTWIRKNIIPRLIENLTKWSNGIVRDKCGFKTLKVIQEISSVLPVEDDGIAPSAQDIISSLNQLLTKSSSNPSMEEMVIRTLCSLGHHEGVKDILSALLDRFLSRDTLHAEIKKAISSSNRKRKELLKKSKNMKEMTAKFMKKKEEIKKKKKKGKKKAKVAKCKKIALEMEKTKPKNTMS